MVDDYIERSGHALGPHEIEAFCVMTTRYMSKEGESKAYVVAVYDNFDRAKHWIDGGLADHYWICRTTLVKG